MMYCWIYFLFNFTKFLFGFQRKVDFVCPGAGLAGSSTGLAGFFPKVFDFIVPHLKINSCSARGPVVCITSIFLGDGTSLYGSN